MRILITEDDFTSRGMPAAVLKKAGHEPVETGKGELNIQYSKRGKKPRKSLSLL